MGRPQFWASGATYNLTDLLLSSFLIPIGKKWGLGLGLEVNVKELSLA
jgi:hypothetical protein